MKRILAALALIVGLAAPAAAQPPIPGVNEFRSVDGSATRPPKSYVQDQDLGPYRIGANNEGFSAGGTLRWDYNATRLKLSSGYTLDFNTTSITETDIAKIDGITNGTTAASKALVTDANGAVSILRTASLRIGTSGAETTVTATGAELNYLAGVTAGTVTASKAAVVDANKDLGTFRHVTLSGNLVTGSTTLTETELGYIDGLTAGTVAASKAIVVDANKDVTGLRYVASQVLTSTSTDVTTTVPVLLPTGSAVSPSLTFSTESGLDSGFYSAGANSIAFAAGGTRAAYFNTSDFVIERNVYLVANAIEGIERSAPAAPAADAFKLFAQDNGGGKTQLCAIFATGAVQCFATQP